MADVDVDVTKRDVIDELNALGIIADVGPLDLSAIDTNIAVYQAAIAHIQKADRTIKDKPAVLNCLEKISSSRNPASQSGWNCWC